MQEHIYMVAVNTLCTFDVAVGVGHSGTPFLTICINTFADAASSVLDCDVKLANGNMAFLIISCLSLRRSRLGVHLGRCGLNCGLYRCRCGICGLRCFALYCFDSCCAAII